MSAETYEKQQSHFTHHHYHFIVVNFESFKRTAHNVDENALKHFSAIFKHCYSIDSKANAAA
ncbi:CLUMA_CG018649, isoform A [Clunio marinus]|uniref:CLUMA_CG018649, isoform A n=1 Tax=Clunio marinus TaxID=568069 RepID=A0A1J1J123_9DIPT|nr:CLUMA_CG018649, isoform A [Clunio marinus]